MQQKKGQGQEGFPSWLRMALGAIVGAVAAAALGFGLSAWFSTFGLALVTPAEGARPAMNQFLARSGLNFLAIHHIRIAGESMPGGPGGVHVSIVWPITMWAIIPAATLMLGGLISARLAGARGPSRFAAGALLAVPYVILLLVARSYFSVPSVSISLPHIEIGGWNPAPESIAAQLAPAIGSTIFHGLLFGVVFGALGAFGGLGAVRRGLFRRDSFWPAWMRGALLALIVGQLVCFLLFAIFAAVRLRPGAGDGKPRLPTRTAATLMPAAAGIAHYLAHGITLRGDTSSSLADNEGFTLRAGLIRGVETDGKKARLPGWAYLAFLIPASALVIGGYAASKTANRPFKKPALAASLAGVYALLLTALSGLYTLTQRSVITVGEMTNRAAVTVGPAAGEIFIFSLILAFVFGFIGVNIYRPDARS